MRAMVRDILSVICRGVHSKTAARRHRQIFIHSPPRRYDYFMKPPLSAGNAIVRRRSTHTRTCRDFRAATSYASHAIDACRGRRASADVPVLSSGTAAARFSGKHTHTPTQTADKSTNVLCVLSLRIHRLPHQTFFGKAMLHSISTARRAQ